MDVTTDLPRGAAAVGGRGRRLLRTLSALVLGLALPTGGIAWLLGFDAMKRRVNRRIWCADATETVFDVRTSSSGSRSYVTDTLLCRKSGAVVRTVGDATMMATNLAVAFGISVVLLGVVLLLLKAMGARVRLGS